METHCTLNSDYNYLFFMYLKTENIRNIFFSKFLSVFLINKRSFTIYFLHSAVDDEDRPAREGEQSRAIIRADIELTGLLAVCPRGLAYSVRCSKSLCGSPLLMPGLLRTYTIGIVPTCPRYQWSVRVCVGEIRARGRVSRGSEIFNINIIYLSTGSDEC